MLETGAEDKNLLFHRLYIMFTFSRFFFFLIYTALLRTSSKQNCKERHEWAVYEKGVWERLSEELD